MYKVGDVIIQLHSNRLFFVEKINTINPLRKYTVVTYLESDTKENELIQCVDELTEYVEQTNWYKLYTDSLVE